MLLGVIGINHKLAQLSLRESLAQACQKFFGIYNAEHQPYTFILVSTCNRTEVYFSSESLADAQSYVLHLLRNEIKEDFDQKLYTFFGFDCFHHLCRVTAGLDSAVLAETEIQGQIKLAYENASAQCSLPSVMHYAFQKALKVGKTVRSSLQVPAGMPSLEQAIFSTGRSHFGTNKTPKVLFVGASYINSKVMDHFRKRGLTDVAISNRSQPQAEAWANKYEAEIVDWNNRNAWLNYNWLIFGTRSPQPLLTANHIAEKSDCLMIDLSVPRNVDPVVGELPGISLYNIDQFNRTLRLRRNKIQSVIELAEVNVANHCQRLVDNYFQKTALVC